VTSKKQRKKNLKKKRTQALKARQARQARLIAQGQVDGERADGTTSNLTLVLDHDPQPELSPAAEQAQGRAFRNRRTLLVAAACVGALVAGGVGMAIWLSSGPDPTPPPATLSAATFDAPVRLAAGTAYVETKVLSSGDLVVTHWIHSRKDLHQMTLAVPELAGLPSSDVEVSHLRVAGDGVELAAGKAGLRPRGKSDALARVVLPGVHDLYVTYQLSGVMQQDSTVATRGLARLTALTVDTDAQIKRTTAAVTGARVLALACSAATPQAIPVPCGTAQGGSAEDGTWSVQLDHGDVHDRVMAQFDMS
jgi:hypothetical protein